ncbi:unnamed protein product [Lactuca virosa]|uniref:Uncharacterized protein n=1 Tax=Lactuca virosa TaxID=75947 RepID=A0AAU9MBR3_9ASTR|nr:unnamed protein product [Lactuca virosa]
MTPSRSNISSSVEVTDDDDDDDDNDDDYDDSDDNDDVNFRLFVPPKEPVNEVVITPAETESVINIFKQPDNPTPEQMETLIKELQSNARKPPQAVPVTVESPSESDKDEPNASQMTKKRRRRDPRRGVLITEPVQQSASIVEPAQINEDVQSPIVEPAQVHEDVQGPIIEPAQESIEKDLLIGKLDVIVSELEKENSQKNKDITEIQANLGGLTAFYFDLKDKLIGKFGDDFKLSSSDGGKAPETSEGVVVRPAPDSNIDQYLSSGPATAEERREK